MSFEKWCKKTTYVEFTQWLTHFRIEGGITQEARIRYNLEDILASVASSIHNLLLNFIASKQRTQWKSSEVLRHQIQPKDFYSYFRLNPIGVDVEEVKEKSEQEKRANLMIQGFADLIIMSAENNTLHNRDRASQIIKDMPPSKKEAFLLYRAGKTQEAFRLCQTI
jgi:hypothetical protein